MRRRKAPVARRRSKAARFSHVPGLIEILESRQLLSASPALALSKLTVSPTVIVVGGHASGSNASVATPGINPDVAGITPSEMQTAYGVNLISFGSVAGTGAGQTVAVVDAFNDPNIIADANTFSQTYNLPQFNGSGGPTLKVLNENGGTSLPANDVGDNWALEESLDVEWAHVIAPQANIILFEASSSSTLDLYTGAQTAAATAGVSVVSMSWGGAEFSYESLYDSDFATPSGHAGVTFLASTGDSGAPAEYPAFSSNVVAVGGTTININSDGSYGSESAWTGGGGGISQYESQPAYQTGKVNGTSSTHRTAPDVSIDAGTGVPILDSYNSGWQTVAGTSLACPMWAGLVAIADQGLALNGEGPLDGPSQTLPILYNLPSSDFHDITTGNDGNPATTGYDLATGIGTPIANLLVPDIVSRYPGIAATLTASDNQNNSLTFSASNGNPISINDGFAGTSQEQLTLSVSHGVLTLASGSGVTVTAGANGSASLTIAGTLAQLNSALNGLVYAPTSGYTGSDSLVMAYKDTVGGGNLAASSAIAITVSASSSQAPSITSANHTTFTAGTAGTFTVTATGSPAPTFGESGTLPSGLTFNTATGVLSGTPVAGTGGTYSLTITASNGVGSPATQTFTLTIDQAPAITSANSATFTVGSAGSFTVTDTGFPAPTFGLTGTLPSGITFNTSTGVLSGTPGAGTGGSYTVTFTASNGVGTQASQSFTITVKQAPAITSASSTTFTVGTAGSFSLIGTGFPAPTFGESGTLPAGLTFNTSTGVLSGTPGAGTGGTYAVTFTASNGVGQQASQSFALTIDQAPTITSANSATFTVGSAGSFTLTASGFPGATFGESGALPAGVSFTAATGTLSGTPTGGTPGTYHLTLTASNGVGQQASQSFTLVVQPAQASKLVFLSTPSTATAGQALSPSVSVAVEDQFGDVVTSDSSTVTLTLNSGLFSTGGTTATAQAVNGVATFNNLIINTAGGHTLAAIDGSLSGATSGAIAVSPGAATKLSISQAPTAGTAGQALGTALTVAVEDAFGNVVTSNTSTVSVGVASGPGGFASGSTTSVAATNGVATFTNLIFNTTGSYTLSVSDGSLAGASSGSFTINPGAASKLAITQTPASGTAGQALGTALKIAVQDAIGNTVTSNGSTLVVSVASGPGGFASGSTTSVAAASGVATLSNLIFDTAGNYTLSVSDGSLTGATSGSFTVSPAAASVLSFMQIPTIGTANAALSPSVQVAVKDQFGNVVASNTSTITVAVASGPGGFAGGSTTSVAAVNGIATFSNLILSVSATYTLKVSDGSLTGATSGNIVVSASSSSKLAITQAPTTGTAGQALSPVLNVSIEDSSGNVVTSNTSTVTVAVASGPGSFASGSTTSVAAVNGVANFSNLIFDTAGSYTLSISDGSLTGATTATITISPGAANKLVITQTPATSTAGQTLATPLKVAVEDAFGNVVTSNTSTIAAAVASGPGYAASGSVTSVAAVSGVGTFGNLIFDTAGAYTLRVSDGSLTGATSGSFTVSPAAASKLVITQTPASGSAGQALSPALTVVAEDVYGNTVTSDSSSIAVSVASGPGGFASGSTTSVAASGGVASFSNLIFDTPGNYTLRVSDGSLTGATSSSFTITPGAASKLVITQSPTSGTAGQALGTALKVSVQDAFGNVVTSNTSTISLSVTTGPSGFATGSTTSVAASAGIASFSNLIFDTAGTYTLSVNAGGLTAATTGSFTVSPAAASKLAITQTPATGVAGQALGTFVVAVEDAFGNVVTPDNSTLTASVAGGPAGFASGSTASVAAVGGVASFGNLIFDTAGTYTLGISDGSLTGATSGGFTVSPAAANSLTIMQTPSSETAGQALSPSLEVAVTDQFGNVITNDTSTISVAVGSGPGGFASGSTSSVAVVNGVATFNNLMLNSSGTYTLSVSDGSLSGATSSGITIGASVATHLSITQEPTAGTAGQALGTALLVAVQNSSGNTVTSDSSTVTVSVASGPGGVANGSTTSIAAVNGVATFSNLIFNTAGTYTLSVSDGSLAGATTATITVSPGAASKLVITQSPTQGVAGQALSPGLAVAVEDAFGNVVASNGSTVTAYVSGGPANFVGSSVISVAVVNGVATFNSLFLGAAGSYTLGVSDGTLTRANTGSFTVTPGAASQLFVSDAPATGTAGQALDPGVTVMVEDACGNAVTSNASITLAVNNGPAGFASGSTLTAAAVNGVATFGNLILDAPGSYTLVASAPSLTSGTSTTITINSGTENKLVVSRAPASGTAGQALGPVTVLIQDASGHTVASNASITLALASGPAGFVGGSTLTVTAVNGVATFSNLIFGTVGNYTLMASGASLTSGVSTPITINAGAARQLFVSDAPVIATAGQVFDPGVMVVVEDAYGNTVTSNASPITLSESSGPGGFASGSTLTATAVNGVAKFSHLILNTAGSYIIAAHSGSLTVGKSPPITVSAAAAAKLAITKAPSSGTHGQTLSALQVAVEDQYGNIVTSNTSTMSVTVSSGPAGFASGSTTTVAAVNGVAMFSKLILGTKGRYTLKVSDGSLTSAMTQSFTVS
ncbi:MAG TPA: putative Ig domain-containing protein [Planctomycetaceae bacterium]|jgi:hypothetical protein|nr:putative Ig domain-containing protein [Planctomycetaceae bacterium]